MKDDNFKGILRLAFMSFIDSLSVLGRQNKAYLTTLDNINHMACETEKRKRENRVGCGTFDGERKRKEKN